jgi:uncharacterized protein
LNHLCAGWKAFFHRANEPIKMMATLMRMGRPASEITTVMAGKEDEWRKALAQARARKRGNDPCPCNSGLKFAQCHGWVRPTRGPKRRGTGAQRPRPPVRRNDQGRMTSDARPKTDDPRSTMDDE